MRGGLLVQWDFANSSWTYFGAEPDLPLVLDGDGDAILLTDDRANVFSGCGTSIWSRGNEYQFEVMLGSQTDAPGSADAGGVAFFFGFAESEFQEPWTPASLGLPDSTNGMRVQVLDSVPPVLQIADGAGMVLAETQLENAMPGEWIGLVVNVYSDQVSVRGFDAESSLVWAGTNPWQYIGTTLQGFSASNGSDSSVGHRVRHYKLFAPALALSSE